MPGNWPEFPGLSASYAQLQNYVNEIASYPQAEGDKCALIQEACDNLECSTSQPFPDLCLQLRQIASGAGCDVNCGPPSAC